MKNPMGFGRGRPPRLPVVFQTGAPSLYFVTFCAWNRKPIFANEPLYAAFLAFARQGHQDQGIAVGRYVLMPDHIHVFVAGPPEFKLSSWARMLKIALGKILGQCGCHPPFWQRGFFDHLVRSSESYRQKWEYVRDNPVRAGLTERYEDWPFQGEVVFIDRD